MFCGRCGAAIPLEARFCGKCGGPVVRTPNPALSPVMFCVKCGTPHGPADKLCASCGSPLPSADGVSSAIPVRESVPESQPARVSPSSQPKPQSENAPYAAFVSTLLGSLLLFSVAVFNVADAFARKLWNSRTSTLVAILGGCLLIWPCWQVWKRLIAVEPETDLKLKSRHRNVIVTSVVFALIFFTISAIVGLVIGRNGAEITQLATDWNRETALARRISEARSAAEATVPSQITMYEKIEPDVEEWESALRRLRADYVIYDAKFPDQHQHTAKNIADLDVELRRAGLLKEQIAVGKAIKLLDADAQWIFWQTRMQPLLDQETALNGTK